MAVIAFFDSDFQVPIYPHAYREYNLHPSNWGNTNNGNNVGKSKATSDNNHECQLEVLEMSKRKKSWWQWGFFLLLLKLMIYTCEAQQWSNSKKIDYVLFPHHRFLKSGRNVTLKMDGQFKILTLL